MRVPGLNRGGNLDDQACGGGVSAHQNGLVPLARANDRVIPVLVSTMSQKEWE